MTRDFSNRLEAFIHVGMHKTGTTSIQESLTEAKPGSVIYYPVSGNHGGQLGTMFEDEPWRLRTNVLRKLKSHEANDLRQRFRKKFNNVLRKSRASRDISGIVFSSEMLSQPKRFAEPALTRMRDALLQHCDHISLIGYVRSPRSFASSLFQQVLRMGGPAEFTPERLWPNYQDRFERMDRVFGRDDVHLKKFDRTTLRYGDVTRDFAEEVGWKISENEVKRSNESIGLEAVALLYALRRAGYAQGGSILKNTTLSTWIGDYLAPLSSTAFRLSSAAFDPVIKKEQRDLRWMERRLGERLDEPEEDSLGAVQSESELLEVAQAAHSLVPGLPEPKFEGSEPFLADYPNLSSRMIADWIEQGLQA